MAIDPNGSGNLRRAAGPRRRRRAALTAGIAAVVALAVVIALMSPHGGSHRSPAAGTPVDGKVGVVDRAGSAVELVAQASGPPNSVDPAAVSSVAATEQQFALKLLSTLPLSPAKNLAVSPASLALALAMLDLGANGPTQQQISALLGPAGASARHIAAGWSGLVADWAVAAAEDRLTLTAANSLWLQQDSRMVAPFMQDLAQYFKAGVWQVDFARDPQAAAVALNAWAAQKTHGLIKSLVGAAELQNLKLVLANAMYLDARWAVPFDHLGAAPPFVRANGSTVRPWFMDVTSTLPSLDDADLTAAQIPYQGGRFAALMMMPKRGTVPELIHRLATTGLGGILSSMRVATTSVALPPFRITTSLDLVPPLQALGLVDAFDGRADLSAMSPDAGFVDSVRQQAVLDVNRLSTQAAAATAIYVAVSAAPPREPDDLVFDHPFVFLIRDTRTGAVLFSAVVQDPTA